MYVCMYALVMCFSPDPRGHEQLGSDIYICMYAGRHAERMMYGDFPDMDGRTYLPLRSGIITHFGVEHYGDIEQEVLCCGLAFDMCRVMHVFWSQFFSFLF